MKGEERRKQLLKILSSSTGPVSGGTLSQELHVSRQIPLFFPQTRVICFRKRRNIPEFLRCITPMTRWKKN